MTEPTRDAPDPTADPRAAEPGVVRHYDRPDLLDRVLAAVAAAGHDPARFPPEALAGLDQLHIGGADETAALAELAELDASMHVIDVGGGVGGPARMLASTRGVRVTVVDLTASFCAAGEELTRRAGLADRVGFRCASALELPFPAGAFDAGWTQHSTMNIADKERLYAELHRVIRPGGTLAIHEICAGPVAPLHFPVPWATEPALSFLRRPDALRAAIAGAGFREVAWRDVTERAVAWVRARLAGPPTLVSGADLAARFGSMLRNLEEGRQEVVQGVFAR